MRNAEDNHDPRGWLDRPSPAGFSRSERLACQARSHCGQPAARRRHRAATRTPSQPTASALVFRRGFTFVPPPPPATVPDVAGLVRHLLTAAQEHFATARYQTAHAFLQLVPQPNAHPAATWQNLAHLHFSLAEYEAAGRAYGYAAAYAPRDPALQVRLAHTCLRLDDFSSFERYLARALALDPDSPAALQLLADLNRDEARYDEAVSYYTRLLEAEPRHCENLLSLALCHSFQGDPEAARECLQRASQAAHGTLAPALTPRPSS